MCVDDLIFIFRLNFPKKKYDVRKVFYKHKMIFIVPRRDSALGPWCLYISSGNNLCKKRINNFSSHHTPTESNLNKILDLLQYRADVGDMYVIPPPKRYDPFRPGVVDESVYRESWRH